eukprot:TRINITY_DN79113_c0_g2_i1.p1 TRINITY_DN79113_c0_g2~~TRINITY_DN79113_c0_g2_i1.p1  ORF type:complete len:138 (-),score=12.60 TRINITY_DN79113_c0_g2_i1:237-650(-)
MHNKSIQVKNVQMENDNSEILNKMKLEYILNPSSSNSLTNRMKAKKSTRKSNMKESLYKNKIRPCRNGMFKKEITSLLIGWILENLEYPYPTKLEKVELIKKTGLTRPQLDTWFYNARRRKIYLKYLDNGNDKNSIN